MKELTERVLDSWIRALANGKEFGEIIKIGTKCRDADGSEVEYRGMTVGWRKPGEPDRHPFVAARSWHCGIEHELCDDYVWRPVNRADKQ